MAPKTKKLLGYTLVAAALVGGVLGLAPYYVTGTITGAVQQAIKVSACNVPVGTCDIAEDQLSFEWAMGNVYQGDSYTATVTLSNAANQDIKVKVLVADISATGGNDQFEGTVEVPEEPITVPAGGTADIPVTVKIHPAEEPGEQYTIKIQVVPYIEE